MDKDNLKANISILKKENKKIKKKIKILKQSKRLDQASFNLPSTLSKVYEIEELTIKAKENLKKIQDFKQQLKQLPTYSTKNAKQRINEIDQETKNLNNEQIKLLKQMKTEKNYDGKTFDKWTDNVSKCLELEFEKESLSNFNKTCIIM